MTILKFWFYGRDHSCLYRALVIFWLCICSCLFIFNFIESRLHGKLQKVSDMDVWMARGIAVTPFNYPTRMLDTVRFMCRGNIKVLKEALNRR